MKFKMYLSLFFIVFSTLNFVSCKSTSISELSQEDGLSRIKESYANEEWSKVVTEVDEYRIRYPYTQYTLDA
jgi:outer membrane protein assembly factor BamD